MQASDILYFFNAVIQMFQVPIGAILGIMIAALGLKWVIKIFVK